MIFRYIAFHYIKSILIILVGLTGLFTGLDFLMNGSSLPSFNMKILYIFSKWEESLNLLYPLALVFSLIWTNISFIKQNTIASFYALGLSRREFAQPFLWVAVGVYILFIGLNFTSFSTAKDRAVMVKKQEYGISKTEDLFFKYDDSFVYIKTLIPLEKRLEGLTVFKLKDYKVFEIIEAKEADYTGSEWLEKDIKREKIISQGDKKRLKIDYLDTLITLKGYNPKILNSIYENKKLTLYESIVANRLLSTQGVDTNKVRADVYNRVITPLFSIALLMILLFRFPFHARYINIVAVTTKALAGTLFIWGVMFAGYRMGLNGVASPEVVMILPIVVLWIFAIYSLIESKNRI